MKYRQDHLRLLKVFARELPKRPSMKVAALAKAAFSDIQKRKPDCASLNPDRACRNALRKPRQEEHIEIAERGEYRLTQKGAAFCKSLDKYEVASDRKDGEPRTKKAKRVKGDKEKGVKVAKKVAKAKVEAKKSAAKKVEIKPVVEKKAAVSAPKKTNGQKPILPPSRKPTKPSAEEQADAAAAKAAEATGEEDPDEIGGDPEPTEDLAAQLNL
jgi:hypothetical protein